MAEKKPVENGEDCSPFISGTKFTYHFCEYCKWVGENKDRVDELITEKEKDILEHESAEKIVELIVNDESIVEKHIKINNAIYHLPLQQCPVDAKSSCTILQGGKQKMSEKK